MEVCNGPFAHYLLSYLGHPPGCTSCWYTCKRRGSTKGIEYFRGIELIFEK